MSVCRDRKHRVWLLEADTPHDMVVLIICLRRDCPPQAPGSDSTSAVFRQGSRLSVFNSYLNDIYTTPLMSTSPVLIVLSLSEISKQF